jgi:hypothetical protein
LFYQDQVKESLSSEKFSELSTEREKMLEIMKKLQNLSYEDENQCENESESEDECISKFEGVHLDGLSVGELEDLLSDRHLKNIGEMMSTGVSLEWLEAANIQTKSNQSPWFMRYEPSKILINEDLPNYVPNHSANNELIPNIKELTKRRPSDFLWNNLVEISIIYAFIYSQFSSEELEDAAIVDCEVRPIILELCTSLQSSASTSDSKGTFTSASNAIDAAKSAIFFNSSEIDFGEVFTWTVNLFKYSKFIYLMLNDVLSWFTLRSNLDADERFAKKKIIFMISWFNSELEESSKTVDGILKMLSDIILSKDSEIDENI